MRFPQVSILITTYNRPEVLRRAIESVLMQDFDDYELIIIDDCSTDNTQQVINSFNDARICNVRNEKNLGKDYGDRTHKHKFIYEIMKGDYFVNFCDDDYWLQPNLISRQMRTFKDYKNLAQVIGGQLTVFLNDTERAPHIDRSNIQDFLDNKTLASKHESVIMQDVPLINGFMTSDQFLELFSRHPAACNINGGASLMSLYHFKAAEALAKPTGSRWQAGYEWFLGAACFGNVVYMNSPELVVEARPKNASFQWTQAEHYKDSIYSINLAFETPLKSPKLKNIKPRLLEHKNEIIRSLTCEFLGNTCRINRDGQLGLCSQENMSSPVTARLAAMTLITNDIPLKRPELLMMMESLKPRMWYKIKNIKLLSLPRLVIAKLWKALNTTNH